MTARRIACAFIGLGVGLLFYLTHRSDHTLSNRVLRWLCGPNAYVGLKQIAQSCFLVPVECRGCLPSALWCFIAASLCGPWTLRLRTGPALRLGSLCPWFNAAWEMVQWLQWTDGHADRLDVVAGFAGWLVALGAFAGSAQPKEISPRWNWQAGVVIMTFAAMGLADVWR